MCIWRKSDLACKIPEQRPSVPVRLGGLQRGRSCSRSQTQPQRRHLSQPGPAGTPVKNGEIIQVARRRSRSQRNVRTTDLLVFGVWCSPGDRCHGDEMAPQAKQRKESWEQGPGLESLLCYGLFSGEQNAQGGFYHP